LQRSALVRQLTGGDLAQPGEQRGFAAILRQAAQRAHGGVLHDVFHRHRRRAHSTLHECGQALQVLLGELPQRCLIAADHCPDKIEVVFEHCRPACSEALATIDAGRRRGQMAPRRRLIGLVASV
jgi:hypothetical protein